MLKSKKNVVWILTCRFIIFKIVLLKKLNCRTKRKEELSIDAGDANEKGHTILVLTTQRLK